MVNWPQKQEAVLDAMGTSVNLVPPKKRTAADE
jgi:hypothetical protein